MHEGELVERMQQQTRTGRNLYDAYVNDSDFIGTHFRSGAVVPLSDWIAGDGAEVTLPTLDLEDFIGLAFTTAPTARSTSCRTSSSQTSIGSAPTGSASDDLKRGFERRYGYRLGVPLNWKAYEDIADFFSNQVREIDGRRV